MMLNSAGPESGVLDEKSGGGGGVSKFARLIYVAIIPRLGGNSYPSKLFNFCSPLPHPW
jgi:hypothetical protein